jgi:hypothetical protein
MRVDKSPDAVARVEHGVDAARVCAAAVADACPISGVDADAEHIEVLAKAGVDTIFVFLCSLAVMVFAPPRRFGPVIG